MDAGGGGFLAAAPNLYYWGSRLGCLWTIMREVTAGTRRTADIDATRDRPSAGDDRTGRIEIIGFCMGGGYALALPASHGYVASSTTRHHEPSAAKAHRRTADFLNRNLTT